MKLLIVEDEPKTAAYLKKGFAESGFSVQVASDGEQGLDLAKKGTFDLVILDVMLPNMDGWEICRALRKISEVPILMLTAREEEIDRVAGLAMGADDYVIKPFSPRELVERVKAILRRSRSATVRPVSAISFNGLELDPVKHTVTRDGRPVALTWVMASAMVGWSARSSARARAMRRALALMAAPCG